MNWNKRVSRVLLLMSHFSQMVGFVKYSISPSEFGVRMMDNSCVEDIFSEFRLLCWVVLWTIPKIRSCVQREVGDMVKTIWESKCVWLSDRVQEYNIRNPQEWSHWYHSALDESRCYVPSSCVDRHIIYVILALGVQYVECRFWNKRVSTCFLALPFCCIK